MILTALVNYYEALLDKEIIAKPGWCQESVSFALNISLAGELLDVIPLKIEITVKDNIIEVPQKKIVPERVVRSSNIAANFLCDNSTYLLGIDQKNSDRAAKCFLASRKIHTDILGNKNSIETNAICNFFGKWKPENASDHPVLQKYLQEITSGGNIVFMINGDSFAQDIPEIKSWWDEYNLLSTDGEQGYCLATGRKATIARIHGKIKGLAKAQASGTALVSYNSSSAHSYGCDERESDAPVSEYATFAYVTALNYLIREPQHRQQIGDTTVVFWVEGADQEMEDIAVRMMKTADDQPLDSQLSLHNIFKRLANGELAKEIDLDTPFYVLGLTPNAGRLSVRLFQRNSFGVMLRNLEKHYNDLEIVRAPYEKEYLSLEELLRETVKSGSKEKSPAPLLSGAIMRSVLTGQPYPDGLYNAVLQRVRSEQDDKKKGIKRITRGRAAIIKACLKRKLNAEEKEVLFVTTNVDTKNKPYVLGRMFAVLEEIQSRANPGINSTIKDRYFASASVTPAHVFPNLIRLSEAHMTKIKARDGKAIYLQKKLNNLFNKLEMMDAPGNEAFPVRLSPKDQGIFILGYYHENQDRFTKKEKEPQEENENGSDPE